MNDINNIQQPITNAPPQIQQIIERVLQAEKDKLYMKFPRNINDDILKIIKEEVQWDWCQYNYVTFVSFTTKPQKSSSHQATKTLP